MFSATIPAEGEVYTIRKLRKARMLSGKVFVSTIFNGEFISVVSQNKSQILIKVYTRG